MNPHEVIGRAVERAENAEEQARALLGLLQQLKEGDVSLDQVEVTAQGLSVSPPEEKDAPKPRGSGANGKK